jgi:hypothetical protein
MSIPEIPDADIPPAPPKNRKAILAWMIVAQIVSVLVILIAIAFGVFADLVGGGVLTGGGVNYLDAVLLGSPILLIPIVVSWVVYKKGKVTLALVLTTVTFFVLACPCLVGILAIAFSS